MNDWMWEKHFTTRNENAAYWHNKSTHLIRASKILWKAWVNGNEGLLDSGDTYLMLMGMSFELMFKAFVVAVGKKVITIHDLGELAKNAGFTLENKEKEIFTILSGYIIWEGRYPVPKNNKKLSGAEGIKSQWESFIPEWSDGQNFLNEEPAIPSKLNRNDLDYDKLLLLWQKFNNDYVNKYIAT
jgi:hypothetical protein